MTFRVPVHSELDFCYWIGEVTVQSTRHAWVSVQGDKSSVYPPQGKSLADRYRDDVGGTDESVWSNIGHVFCTTCVEQEHRSTDMPRAY